MYVGDFNVHPIKIQDKNNTKGRGAKISCCKIPYHGGYCLKKKKKKKQKKASALEAVEKRKPWCTLEM